MSLTAIKTDYLFQNPSNLHLVVFQSYVFTSFFMDSIIKWNQAEEICCTKSVHIRSFSRIRTNVQSKRGKIRTRETQNTDFFHAVIVAFKQDIKAEHRS